MKTNILIIRHAQSVANNTGMFGGITDYELSQEGFSQADILATRLKDIEVDKIYSSPLKGAFNTIRPTANMKKIDINIIDGLKEINMGEWEDKLICELKEKHPKETEYITKTEYYTGIIGQEETIDVANRMYDNILKVAEENLDKTIIVTSHLAAIRAFLCKIMNIPFEETKDKIGNLDNASITKIIYDNNERKFFVEYLGEQVI